MIAICEDCKAPYRDLGLDITFSDEQWSVICSGESEIILCGSCIARRAETLSNSIAIRAYIEFADDSRWREMVRVKGEVMEKNELRYLSAAYEELDRYAYCSHCGEWFKDDYPIVFNSLYCPNECGYVLLRAYTFAEYKETIERVKRIKSSRG